VYAICEKKQYDGGGAMNMCPKCKRKVDETKGAMWFRGKVWHVECCPVKAVKGKKKIFEKEYTVNAGQEDWRIWTRATDYLSNWLFRKRRERFRERQLGKPVTIKLEVWE
jgi:hypothetical protein